MKNWGKDQDTQAWELLQRKNLGGSRVTHPLQFPHCMPKNQNLCNVRLSWGHFYGDKDNCNITKQCANAFLLHLLTNFHLQLSTDLPKSTFFIILKIMSLSGFVHQKPNKPNTQVTNKQWVLSVPPASHLWLDQTSYHLLISTRIYWHSRSHWTFCDGWQFKWKTW